MRRVRSPSGCREAPFFEAPCVGVPSRVRSGAPSGGKIPSAVEPGSCSRGGRSWRSAPPASGTDRPGSRRKPRRAQAPPGDDDRRQRRFLVCRQPPRRVALWTVVKPLQSPLHCNATASAMSFGDVPVLPRGSARASPPTRSHRPAPPLDRTIPRERRKLRLAQIIGI